MDFAERMRDAPCVTIQKTFYKTYYKLPVSMFTCVKRQPIVIYNINLFNPEPRYFGVGDGRLRWSLDVNRISL